jgi:feruloyl esterase
MMRLVAACLVLGAAASAAAQTAPILERCTVERYQPVTFERTTVRDVSVVPAGTFRATAGAPPLANVPAFCRVQASVQTSTDSMVTFEVWIPERWNGKFVVTGNGGYGNVPSYRDMANALAQGYAAAGGDTGHQTPTPDDLLWGVGHPERILDWGSRSIHAITSPARRLVEQAGGASIRRAYFYGCSTGGHQAYAEIQRYPGDFDGVVAGAPGNNRVRLNAAFLWQFLANHERGSSVPILPPTKLPLVTRAVVAACDSRDGVTDGVVDDPRGCRFDPASLLCKAGDAADCLTAGQVAAVKKMYEGPKNPRTGVQVYPGWPPGSEALTSLPDGRPGSGWQQYWGTTEPTRASFWRSWVFGGPEYDWWGFDFDRDLRAADEKVGPLVDQVNPDLSAFKARGGKVLVYQGWQDPVVNALDTIAYYEQVRTREGSQKKTDEFFRLFLVPGMGHCSGGTGTTLFGNQGGVPPTVDSGHDVLAALDAWVETGAAPARIIASRVEGGKTVRTRPLCPYPTKAVYGGAGSTDEAASFTCLAAEAANTRMPLAATPPMGWNSWDAFGTTVTEAEVKANADAMAKSLKSHGWQYVVVDIQWSDPDAKAHGYRPDASLVMDGYGRLMPAPKRFPSSVDGRGFKPLSDYVHRLGLKFGIHIMRGIPRRAVDADLPIIGTAYRASNVADKTSVCPWNTDMYGIDVGKPGGREYYDSIVRLYASWGVDFIKADDMFGGGPRGDHSAEIDALSQSIRKVGRPIVLSLSPGVRDDSAADFLAARAQMWRISDDFWDRWVDLKNQFPRLDRWSVHSKPGQWPDADMLPLGRIGVRAERGEPRMSRLTRDEQVTLMTLWSIARSPLMFGGNLPDNDDFTLSLITNDEVLAVNQRAAAPRQLFARGNQVAWVADAPGPRAKYVAVFNLGDAADEQIRVDWADAGLAGRCVVRDLWARKDIGTVETGSTFSVKPHGAVFVRLTCGK